MESRHLKTEFGTFKVQRNDVKSLHKETREPIIISSSVSVGGKNTCVYIKIDFDKDFAYMSNLKVTDGGCELSDKEISGNNTTGMVNLAFTIVKENFPHIKYIRLHDTSDFPCELSNGQKIGISLSLYSLLFYQKMYYEKKFGAYLEDEDTANKYKLSLNGFNDKPPTYFSFNNEDLQEMLEPILEESLTWKDFFTIIHSMPHLCERLIPWYQYALDIILNGKTFERSYWRIEIYNNPLTPIISYTEVSKNKVGGKRKTRKRGSLSGIVPSNMIQKPYDYVMYDELYNLKYK
jgi:hypothetical protein